MIMMTMMITALKKHGCDNFKRYEYDDFEKNI